MRLKNLYRTAKINHLLASCAALAFTIGIPSAAHTPMDLQVPVAKADTLELAELSASDPSRARLIDLIEEFDAKIDDINQKNPEMARLTAESFSGGHMNQQSGQMEEKFGRVTPSNTTRNGLLGSVTNALLLTALLSNLAGNQQGTPPNEPAANPEITPSAIPTPALTTTPTPTVTPTPTPTPQRQDQL